MGPFIIIADDLTGALDTGVRLSPRSTNTLVLRTGCTSVRGLLDNCSAYGKAPDVVVIDTDTRHLPPEQAAMRVDAVVRDAIAATAEAGGRPTAFYKKTDSALRGNVGSEITALLKASGADVVFFVPAHPELGRTTVSGTQLIYGVPIAGSEFGHDHRSPVSRSSVAKIIAQQTDTPTEVVPIERVYAGESISRDPKRIIVCDAETEEHLRVVGSWIGRQRLSYELAGCAGFASELPNIWRLGSGSWGRAGTPGRKRFGGTGALIAERREALVGLSDTVTRGLLAVSGSRHPRSLEQLRIAVRSNRYSPRRTTETRFSVVGVDPAGEVNAAWFAAKSPSAEDTTSRSGASQASDPDSVAQRLASEAVQQMLTYPPGAVAIFGGDTAKAVLDALEVRTIRPVLEIEPGVVLSLINSIVLPKTRWLVTKAGGFGTDALLLEIQRGFEGLIRRGIECGLR